LLNILKIENIKLFFVIKKNMGNNKNKIKYLNFIFNSLNNFSNPKFLKIKIFTSHKNKNEINKKIYM
jgi:hypothetical protein